MRQVEADLVGGRPAQVFGQIHHQDVDHLLPQGHADKDERQTHQQMVLGPGARLVDERAQDLGVDQLQADVDEQGDSQPDNQGHPRAEVTAQEGGIFAERDGLCGLR